MLQQLPTVLAILLMTTGSGACILLGGGIASIERIRPDWLEQEFRHFLVAFGGGILVGAVALVLVPEGIHHMRQSPWAIAAFLFGSLVFFLIERALGLRRRETPQLMGMMLDYIPEAIALGGLAASKSPVTALLALLIGLQNLPEGFNSYRELKANSNSKRRIMWTMLGLVTLGPIAGLLGYYFLSGFHIALGCIMLSASGGILYLVFQDIAPQSRLDKHWAPPLGAAFGFCLALLGNMLIGH